LNQLLIVPISQAASSEFDRLRAVSKYRQIGRADLLIASISLANRAVLVTRNQRHFKQIPGLRVENWVD
jgi:tRNA(fMet)-specific endonuclease VapC